MPDIIYLLLLGFLGSRIRLLAIRKGVNSFLWIVLMLLAWLFAGSIGGVFAMNYLNIDVSSIKQISDILALPVKAQLVISGFSLFFAFGGYLLVRLILERKPDKTDDDVR